ncbi:MAG TPA: hypothetical protein VLN45_11300 [Ignavibacteriaceae bacterium]|nr:hypothetical protein [Ignavibacteriaceae bacterium]
MPLRTKYQPIIDLIEELNGEVTKAEEERGFFVIEGFVNSDSDLSLVKRKTDKINDIKADEINLNLIVKK